MFLIIRTSVIRSNIHFVVNKFVHILDQIFETVHDVSASHLEVLVTWCFRSRELPWERYVPANENITWPKLLVEKPGVKTLKTRSKVSKKFIHFLNIIFNFSHEPYPQWGAVVAWWLGCWTHDSRVVGSIPKPGMVRFWSLGNFIYPDLPQHTQLWMSTNIVGKVPATD